MKKLSTLIAASFLSFALVACGANKGKGGGGGGGGGLPETFTVAFNLDDDSRYKTLYVEENQHIDQTEVPDPTKEGYVFDGWFDGTTQLDFETYVVTHDVTFTARFSEDEEPDPYPNLDVNAVKEADHTYYLVFGWWDDTVAPKSNLTTKDAKVIYANMLTYLRAREVAETDIANIQFRNYSSDGVAAMGAAINSDADVSIIFGVGNNINSSTGANVSLNHGSNDYKFQTPQGAAGTSRYVANLTYTTEMGEELFLWLKNTDCGKAALTRVVTAEEVAESLAVVIDYTVTIHGETDQVVHIEEAGVNVTPTTVVIPEGKVMVGYATEAEGEVVLEKSSATQTITYAEIVALANDDGTLDLYPVFEDAPVVTDDLVVYVQTSSSLKEYEAHLLEERFKATLDDDKSLRFVLDGSNASGFAGVVNAAKDADVLIGGNNPVGNGTLGLHAENPSVGNGHITHFAHSDNRKVAISAYCSNDHLALAKTFHAFVLAEAPTFEVHTTFWTKTDNSWVSVEERAAAVAGIRTQLNTYLEIAEDKTLEETYNIQLTFIDITSNGDKAADLGAATNALREGKGTDLIIGCGATVKSKGGVNDVEHKPVDGSFLSEGSRYISLVRENILTRYIYDNLYLVPEVVEG